MSFRQAGFQDSEPVFSVWPPALPDASPLPPSFLSSSPGTHATGTARRERAGIEAAAQRDRATSHPKGWALSTRTATVSVPLTATNAAKDRGNGHRARQRPGKRSAAGVCGGRASTGPGVQPQPSSARPPQRLAPSLTQGEPQATGRQGRRPGAVPEGGPSLPVAPRGTKSRRPEAVRLGQPGRVSAQREPQRVQRPAQRVGRVARAWSDAQSVTEGWGAPALDDHGFRPETQAVPGVQPEMHRAVGSVCRAGG